MIRYALLLVAVVASAQMHPSPGPGVSAGRSEVVLTATITSGGTPPSGQEATKAYDGDVLTTFSASPAGSAWVGIDAGKAVTLRRFRLTPRAGDQDYSWATQWVQPRVEASNAANFSTKVTLWTMPAWDTGLPNVYPMQWHEFQVDTAGTAYRYYRFFDPTPSLSFGDVAEIRWYVDVTTGLSARPAPPQITPGSGAVLSGTARVAISSLTTNATFRYTTDGSAPTCSSTLYSGPFDLTVAASATLKAVACDAGLSTEASEVSSQVYRNFGWTVGTQEYDQNGQQVVAHQGGIIYADSKYWRTGTNVAFTLTNLGYLKQNKGIWLYSGSDLYSWRREKQIIQGFAYAHSERSHIVYNASTEKYVLWENCGDNYGGTPWYACIATADHPLGPWTVASSNYSPGGLGFKDNNLFVDDDGTGYVVFAAQNQADMAVMQLSADYTSVVGDAVYTSRQEAGKAREAPCLFKRGSTYFLITSSSNGLVPPWDLKYQTASSPLGTWSAQAALPSRSITNTYDNQCTQVMKVPGKTDAYLYIGTQWVKGTYTGAGKTWGQIYDTKQIYLPLTFPTATTVQLPVEADAPTNWNTSYWQ